MDYLYLLVFLIFSHLVFKQKGPFFVFRSIGLFLVLSNVYYYIYRVWGTVPSLTNPLHVWYVTSPDVRDFTYLFSSFALAITLFKFLKQKNFRFLVPEKSDFKIKELVILLGLMTLFGGVSLVHFNFNVQTPNYVSIDAPLHFSKFRKTLEHQYNSNDVPGATLSAYVLTHLFLPDPKTTDIALADFQLINILTFSLIAAYFLFLAYRSFAIKPPVLAILAAVLTAFGYFFNLMIMGFMSQLMGLFLLLFFLDVFPEGVRKWHGLLLLAIITMAQLQTYSYYWVAVMAIFIGLVLVKKIIAMKNGLRLLLPAVLLIAIAIALLYHKTTIIRRLLSLANSDGEMYKIIAANFLPLLPLVILGIYLALRKWKHDKSEFATMFLASLVFTLLSAAAYFSGYFSTYTFVKSFYLSGPFILFFSVYSMTWFQGKFNNGYVKAINTAVAAVILISVAVPIIKTDADPNTTFTKLVASENDKNIWSIKQRPLDIFRFNGLVFKNKNNRIENFISFDRDKLEFIKGLKEHLPEQYQSYYAYDDPISIEKENRITMVADFKTSYWMFSLTKIWNRANDNMAEHNEQIVNYEGWLGHYQEPYIIIFDTQSTNRWLWMNEKKFKWEDYKVVYKVGNNYLLKLREKRFPPPA